MSNFWHNLVDDNPMMNEASRAIRRFLNSNGETGKGVNLVVAAFIVIFYVWLLGVIVRLRENVTAPVLLFELTVQTLLIPAIVYNAISVEFEKATWEALILTRLSTLQIVLGKLVWRIGVALGISALFFLPFILSLLMGDRGERVSWQSAFMAKTLILAWGILLCGFGLWVSANTSKTVTTISILIASLIGVLALLPTVFALFGVDLSFQKLSPQSLPIFFLNPYISIQTLFGNNADGMGLVFFICIVYIAAAAVFVYMTYHSLRRRDAAQRTISR